MATVASSVTVFFSLLFLFTFSYARDIQLASAEPASQIHPEPETTPSTSKPHQHDTVSFIIQSTDPVPLTFFTSRPINRHVQPRRPSAFPFPLSLRPGHHHYVLNQLHREEEEGEGDHRQDFEPAETRFPEMMDHHQDFEPAEPRFPEMRPHHHDHRHRHDREEEHEDHHQDFELPEPRFPGMMPHHHDHRHRHHREEEHEDHHQDFELAEPRFRGMMPHHHDHDHHHRHHREEEHEDHHEDFEPSEPRFPEMMARHHDHRRPIHNQHHREEEHEEGWFTKGIHKFLDQF